MFNPDKMTNLIDIRNFLTAHGANKAPWGTPKEAIEQLYTMLAEKRDDRRFWADLKDLVVRLEDHRFNAEAMKNSQALGVASVDDLIDVLKRELGQSSAVNAQSWMSRPVGYAAILGFLLLGSSISCNTDNGGSDAEDSDDDTSLYDDDTNGNSNMIDWEDYTCDALAEDYSVSNEDKDVLCDLVDYVMESDIPNYVKIDILECLPEQDAKYREMLLETFQLLNDDEIAGLLQNLASTGATCSDPYMDDDH